MGNYTLRCDLGMSSVAAKEVERTKNDLEFIDESVSDFLKPITLATLLAIPGIVDGAELAKGLKGASANGNAKVVQVNSPKVQKKIYDIIGKDKYVDAVIVNIIARTLMSEAVGEKSNESFDAVASVIWNRAGGDKNKIIDVIFSPSQFSCWNKMTDSDKRNFVIKPHGRALTNPVAWQYCVSTAKKMVDGTFVPSGTWKFYYAHNKVTPKWASKLTNTKKIGNHTFGTL